MENIPKENVEAVDVMEANVLRKGRMYRKSQ